MLARIGARIVRLRPRGIAAWEWLVPPLLLLLLALSGGMASAGLPARPPTVNPDAMSLTGQTAARQDGVQPVGRSAQMAVPAGATATPCGGPSTWRVETPMAVARAYDAGAVVGNQLYVISGFSTAPDPAVERFDPGANTWTTRAPIPTPISQARAAALGGTIYVAGGFNNNFGGQITAMQIYSTATNTWTQGAPLPEARSGAGVAALNGKIYVISGFGPGFATTSTVYEYDPSTNTYTTRAPVPAVAGNVAVGVLGNLIYAVGGADVFLHYAYDPAANTWATIADGLTLNFQTPGVFALNGELWVEGGTDGFTPYPPDQQVQIYNPVSNTWRFGPTFNTPRYGSSAAGASGGRGYVAGGRDINGSSLNSMESITYLSCATPTSSPTSTPTSTPTATSTATGTPCTLRCSDVHPDDYFYEPMRYLYCLLPRGGISGYGDGTCRPYNLTTRSQLSKIVVIAEAWPIYTPPTPTFRDVPTTDTFYTYIETAYNHGIISGYNCGSGCLEFHPYSNVTRGQLCKIVVLAEGWPIYTPPAPTFRDVPPTDPFYGHIETAYQHGIISGYSCGPTCLEFRPGSSATRGQICKIVYLAVVGP